MRCNFDLKDAHFSMITASKQKTGQDISGSEVRIYYYSIKHFIHS